MAQRSPAGSWDLTTLEVPPFTYPEGPYQNAYPLVDGLAPVCVANRGKLAWGLADARGVLAVPAVFKQAHVFAGGRFAVVRPRRTQWGFADRSGSVVIDEQFDLIDVFSEGLCAVTVKKKTGFIDADGAFVIPPTFAHALAFSEGIAPVRLGKRWGYVDRAGNVVIEPRFAHAFCFRGGVAQVVGDLRRDDAGRTFGVIDRTGAYVIEPRFDYCAPSRSLPGALAPALLSRRPAANVVRRVFGAAVFTEGLAAVREKGRWGYIDARGVVVIPPRFVWAKAFAGGRAEVWTDRLETIERPR